MLHSCISEPVFRHLSPPPHVPPFISLLANFSTLRDHKPHEIRDLLNFMFPSIYLFHTWQVINKTYLINYKIMYLLLLPGALFFLFKSQHLLNHSVNVLCSLQIQLLEKGTFCFMTPGCTLAIEQEVIAQITQSGNGKDTLELGSPSGIPSLLFPPHPKANLHQREEGGYFLFLTPSHLRVGQPCMCTVPGHSVHVLVNGYLFIVKSFMALGCSVTLVPVPWQVCRERKTTFEIFIVLGFYSRFLSEQQWGEALAAFQNQKRNWVLLNTDNNLGGIHGAQGQQKFEFCLSESVMCYISQPHSFALLNVGLQLREKSVCCDLFSPLLSKVRSHI